MSWGDRHELAETLAEARAAREQDDANAEAYVGLILSECPHCVQGAGCTYCGHSGYVLRGEYKRGEGR